MGQPVLLQILRRKIDDEGIRWLVERVVRSHPAGIPIGNLTSQLFANVYLNELDQYVKRELRERYYLRYMDDFLVLGLDKKHLQETKERVREFLRERLKLELHPKKAEIFPIDKGVDFLGYVIRGRKRLLRKSTVRRFLKKRKRYLKLIVAGQLPESVVRNIDASWRGYTEFADSCEFLRNLGIGRPEVQSPSGPRRIAKHERPESPKILPNSR